ncbi:putative zinc finger protein [Operophtera brumata]|uniref:Putative zinc finger protein n=1 Tax=Operophtera brumata TaxID=104452 RepID=A0A0L7LP82_OPEBR|nr:putative zinc finger protein [Operophtera brumata]
MKVITPPGDYVGRVQQQCTWVIPVYRVRDANDQVLFIIEGPAVLKRSALMLSEFKILTGDSLREVGRIAHGWDRDLVSFATTLQIPDLAVQPKHKCLLLAATFLLFLYIIYLGMVKSLGSCPVPTNAGKILTYDQYYTGHKDDDQRKNGHGENHWSGPESLEWYTGSFLHDTMHGVGEYRTRYRGDKGVFVTYEGHFYANRMHGYGTMSYPNGAVFTNVGSVTQCMVLQGLFHKDMRWGPGIESQACLREDVGLWRGTQLVRLAWQPATPNVALDLCIGLNGKACVEPHRIVLAKRIQTIGEANSAIELLKQSGSDPISASVNWTKLYPKTCTDLASQLCYVEVFEHDYYNSRIIPTLEKVTGIPDHEKNENQQGGENFQTTGTFYAWNNNEMVTHMMKHSFKHENQRAKYGIELKSVLSGPRNQFKQAGKHEIDCRTLLMASYLGHLYDVAQLVNDLNVHTDVADIQGNTALMYATCGDQVDIIHFLVEAGADVNSYCDTCCTPLGVALMRFVCATKDISASQMVQALIPPPIVPAPPPVTTEQMPTEWHMSRGVLVESPRGLSSKPVAKASVSVKKVQPNPSKNSVMSVMKKKTELAVPKSASFADDDADEKLSEEKRLYDKINIEFSIRVTDLFSPPILLNPIPYLFKINDMIIEVDAFYEEQNKPPENNPKKAVLKVIKDTVKPSKEIMWQNSDGDGDGSIDSVEKAKNETLSKIMMTILQLLSDGAAPCLVRCPQPALLIATVSGCPNLVRQLVSHGIDVNEVYPQSLHYTALDVAVSQPFTYENLELVRALLECGAKTDHILRYAVPDTADPAIPEVPGPTLLHAVLARKTENDVEEELQQKLLEMLLEYKCNPMIQFKGRSSADVAMTKNMDVFDQFLKCPRTNLNAAINDANETVLLKIFSKPFYTTIPTTERLQTVKK